MTGEIHGHFNHTKIKEQLSHSKWSLSEAANSQVLMLSPSDKKHKQHLKVGHKHCFYQTASIVFQDFCKRYFTAKHNNSFIVTIARQFAKPLL